MRLVVTGATGFVGTAFVRHAIASGARVEALVRATSATATIESLGVHFSTASLTEEGVPALAELVSEADAVVHLAGGGRVRSPDEFVTNNRTTTSALIAAINRAARPPKRFVLFSSMAARGPAPSADRSESTVADAPITAYGTAKLEAERCLRDLRSDVSAITLRPPGIYGPGDDRMLPLYRAARSGLLPIPAAGRSASFVDLDDCVRAIERALDCSPSAEPMYIEDGEPRSTREVARLIATNVGGEARIVPVPSWALRAAGALSELAARARNAPAVFTRDKARDLTQAHWVCDSRPYRGHTGWSSEVAMPEGVERTVHDYRARGWL